jgi:hypothetical protein
MRDVMVCFGAGTDYCLISCNPFSAQNAPFDGLVKK